MALLNFHTHRLTILGAALMLIGSTAQAESPLTQTETNTSKPGAEKTETQLPTIKVQGSTEGAVTPGKITSTTKGETKLLTAPQSISVVTRELMDSRQDKTLIDAVRGVAGVVAGERGNRGFDDIGIRGQAFGQEKYIDGLNTMRQGYVPAEEIFGAERIEVLKGPASLLYGNVRPGGMVNVVSKQPKAQAFGELGASIGNYGFKQLTADLGRPISEDGRSAFRLVALGNDSDDATDFVFFKNKYIAPSLRLALSDKTELTLLTSYQDREWRRLQGLPPKGTVLPNINGKVDRSLFIGEPSFGNNEFDRTRVGYELQHRFDENWRIKQNFRWDDYTLKQRPSAFYEKLAPDERTQSRTGSIQHDDYRVFALDTYLNGKFNSAIGVHELTLGVDLNDKHGRLKSQSCTTKDMGTIDLFSPTYGRSITCTGALADNTQDIRAAGLYLRDRLSLTNTLHLTTGLRHDHVTSRTFNNQKSSVSSNPSDSARTGMIGLSWEASPGIAPYASWANSFVPTAGTDFYGKAFKPETSEQIEAGIKFERNNGRHITTIAVYDLKRQNILTNDLTNNGFNIQQGEHHSKGLEIETAAEFNNGLSLNAAYAYTDAEISKSNIQSEIGKTVNNVPKHSASVWGLYRLAGPMEGFNIGLGIRHVSDRTGASYNFTVPGYTVFDAALQYRGKGWRAALNVRNLTDKTIYGGALSDNVVTLGETRTVRLNFIYEL